MLMFNVGGQGFRHSFHAVVAAAVLLVFATVLLVLAWKQSPDYDEHVMVAAGLSYIERGDARLNWEHPPLTKLLGGAGAKLAGVSGNYDSDAWRYEREFDFASELYTRANPAHLHKLVFLPRIPMVIISVGLGVATYLWVASVSGGEAGLLALVLYCTCPLVLAWGVFVLNDVALAFFSLLTCWAAVATWRNPSVRLAVGLGLALGLAMMSKFSAVLLFPILVSLVAILSWQQRRELSAVRLRKLASAFLTAFVVAGAVVYVTYQYAYRNMPPHQFVEVWQQRADVQGTARPAAQQAKMIRLKNALGRHPVAERVVAPAFYFATGVYTIAINTSRPSWILGRYYPEGRWFYFPVVALFKLPPGLLLIVVAGLVVFLARGRKWLQNPDVLAMALLLAIYTAGYMRSQINIGMRYYVASVAVAIALGCTVLVPEIRAFSGRRRTAAAAFGTAAILQCAVAALLTYPFYIPYYNLFRGHHPREFISSDANVDHGTYLPWLHQFENEHRVERLSLVGFSLSQPVWVPEASRWDCEQADAPTRWVVVSAAFLEGAHKDLPCARLRQFPAHELAGGSMWAFDVGDPNGANRLSAHGHEGGETKNRVR
jgi:4-amino-4-deoxy-L-arabinose transferase-like glycosyltransferase